MVSPRDRAVLRDVARRVAEIASLPEMAKRQARWREHNALQPGRPMVLVFPEGAWIELVPEQALHCEGEAARRMERDLRQRVYTYEHLHTDNVVTAEWPVGKRIHNTGWGLQAKHRPSTVQRGSWAFDPVILKPADLGLLRHPRISYDEEATQASLAAHQELFGDLLDVRLVGVRNLSFHFMNLYTGWRGLEQVMVDMYAEPAMLHDAMAFLEEGYRGLVQQYVDLNLLTVNNDNTYHSSGGNGYLDDALIHGVGFDPERVRPGDLWASAEAQEMSEVSPRFHREFVMEYEARVLEPFALNGYGCCEPLDRKLDDVFEVLPRIRRVSISPFSNVERCAEQIQNRAIFSWKPQPSHLVGRFDEDLVRGYLRDAIEAARGCILEIILKDTHTCEHHPERFTRWTQLAQELVVG